MKNWFLDVLDGEFMSMLICFISSMKMNAMEDETLEKIWHKKMVENYVH